MDFWARHCCYERWLDRVWLPDAKDLGFHQLYRALDLLAEQGAAIEEEVFWNSADLFKLDVDLIFYDATTAWFETDDEDVASHEWRGLKFEPLRKRGHSKEGWDADETGLAIIVAHLPPGTAKWNRIEHRLFAYISQNWRGKPLVSHQVIVQLIGATKTENGLTVTCDLDRNLY